jgi:hypothetical protein
VFVRPPLWRYTDKGNPEIGRKISDTYQRLGLKMMLTDARYPDGGYVIISMFNPCERLKFQQNLQRAFLGGEDLLIISMHDSNVHTARRLAEILDNIKEVFSGMNFGGVRADPGDYLDFADSTAELRQILDAKLYFTAFPRYCPGDNFAK